MIRDSKDRLDKQVLKDPRDQMGQPVTKDRPVREAIQVLQEPKASQVLPVLQGPLDLQDLLGLVVNLVREEMLVQLDHREQMVHQARLENLVQQEQEETSVHQDLMEQLGPPVLRDPEGTQAHKAQPALGEAKDQQAVREFRVLRVHRDSEVTMVSLVPADLLVQLVREERPDLEEMQDRRAI